MEVRGSEASAGTWCTQVGPGPMSPAIVSPLQSPSPSEQNQMAQSHAPSLTWAGAVAVPPTRLPSLREALAVRGHTMVAFPASWDGTVAELMWIGLGGILRGGVLS